VGGEESRGEESRGEERRGGEGEWGRLADRRLREMRLVGRRGARFGGRTSEEDCSVQRKWTWTLTLVSEDTGRGEGREGKGSEGCKGCQRAR
jgi:hypothetical protein